VSGAEADRSGGVRVAIGEGADQPVALRALEIVDTGHELRLGADLRAQLDHRPI